MRAASCFLAALGLAGLLILVQLPVVAVYVGCAAVPLVVLYPLAKRVTWFPQMVLGLTFSWGILLGWAAAQNSLPPLPVLQLYAGAACWVFGYDTIYAVQDMADDRLVGVKSSALALAGRLRLAVGTAFIAAVGLIGTGLWWSGIEPAGQGLFSMERTGGYGHPSWMAGLAIGTAQSRVSVASVQIKPGRRAVPCRRIGCLPAAGKLEIIINIICRDRHYTPWRRDRVDCMAA